MECPICCNSLINNEIYPFDGCDHVYCKDCLNNYLGQAVYIYSIVQMKERRITINCPNTGCKNVFTEYDICAIGGKDCLMDYNKYTLDNFVDTHADEMSWCPTADCGYAFVIGDEEGDNEFHCPLCKKV